MPLEKTDLSVNLVIPSKQTPPLQMISLFGTQPGGLHDLYTGSYLLAGPLTTALEIGSYVHWDWQMAGGVNTSKALRRIGGIGINRVLADFLFVRKKYIDTLYRS